MQIDWWTFALQAVNFLVLVWLLWRFLFRPVKRVIEERKKLADEAFKEASEKEAEADAARKRFEESRAALAQEREETLKRLHQEMEEERAKALETARAEAKSLLEEAKESAEKERKAALKALRGEVVGLAADMAKKVLQHSSALPAVLDLAEKHLAGLEEEELERLRQDLEPEEARLLVVTAKALSAEEQAEVTKRLAKALGHEDRVAFDVEPGLLGGLELRLPHNVISFSWADQLRQAEELISGDEKPS